VRRVTDHVLMGDRQHRDVERTDHLLHPGQRLEEIDDEVGTGLLNQVAEGLQAGPPDRESGQRAPCGQRHVHAAAVPGGEPGARRRGHRHRKRLGHVGGQGLVAVAPDDNPDQLMPRPGEDLLHREGLGHVPAPFALDREEQSHGSGSG
jgi:hypothetical protein